MLDNPASHPVLISLSETTFINQMWHLLLELEIFLNFPKKLQGGKATGN